MTDIITHSCRVKDKRCLYPFHMISLCHSPVSFCGLQPHVFPISHLGTAQIIMIAFEPSRRNTTYLSLALFNTQVGRVSSWPLARREHHCDFILTFHLAEAKSSTVTQWMHSYAVKTMLFSYQRVKRLRCGSVQLTRSVGGLMFSWWPPTLCFKYFLRGTHSPRLYISNRWWIFLQEVFCDEMLEFTYMEYPLSLNLHFLLWLQVVIS